MGRNVLNKSDLAAAVAEAAGISKSDAASAIDATFDTIANALKDGFDIRLSRFGSFGVADSPAREGRNPRTGETVRIAASKRARFKAEKGLKDAVNN
jgi:DNA-binding protein HU-beta